MNTVSYFPASFFLHWIVTGKATRLHCNIEPNIGYPDPNITLLSHALILETPRAAFSLAEASHPCLLLVEAASSANVCSRPRPMQ